MFVIGKKSRTHNRMSTGSVGALFLPAAMIASLGLGALGVDFLHMLAVRTDLQNAVDAAALAGAHELKTNPENAELVALNVAGQNKADGRAVSNESAGTNVTAQTNAAGIDDAGSVTVSADMEIRHLLAPIFGRVYDHIQVSATAAYYASINILAPNQAFPIAMSIDQWPNGPKNPEKPYNQLSPGQDVTLMVRPSAVPGRNAAWTSFNISSANTNTYVSLVEQVLNLRPVEPDRAIPALEAGVSTIMLDNGVNQGTGVYSTYQGAIKQKPFITIPLFAGNAYNTEVTVEGFATIKVSSVDYNSGAITIVGKIVKASVRGWGGSTGNSTLDENSPTVVKLLPGPTTAVAAAE